MILFWMRWTWKSTIWKIISERLNYKFVDLDKFMNQKVWDINDYIQEKGWDAFRDLEHESLNEVLKLDGNYVISLWWWTIIFPRNVEQINKLDDKILIFLETKLENIAKRIEKDEKNNKKRASLTWKSVLDELKEVYTQREDIYKQKAQYIINNDGSLEETIEDILKIVDNTLQTDKIPI